LAGFRTQSHSFNFDQTSKEVDFVMSVGALEESVTVSASTPAADQAKTRDAQKAAAPSQNVINLQRRAAGVLPVRVDVPRAGVSHQFVKPLVVDQETVVSPNASADIRCMVSGFSQLKVRLKADTTLSDLYDPADLFLPSESRLEQRQEDFSATVR
jgi:hypothetical protein